MSDLAQGRGRGGDSAVTLRRARVGGGSWTRCGALRFLVVILGCTYFASRAGAAVSGDADCNGVLDSNDLAAVIVALTNPTNCTGADANGDRQVTAADLVAEVNWLTAGTPTPTSSPTASPTSSPTSSPTATAADTATPEPLGTATSTPTLTVTVTPSATVSFSPTWTLTPSTTSTISPTATITDTPSQTPTATLTLTSSSTPTSTRTATNTVAPLPTTTNTPLPTATTIPTATPVPPPTPAEPGPQVTFFGIAKADGCFACDVECGGCARTPSPTPIFDVHGRRVFLASSGNGFFIVVEARPGSNGAKVGAKLEVNDPSVQRPDLQIESTQNMGAGSAAVCDIGAGTGGIPGIPQPDFGPVASDALADFACRFKFYDPASPCTNDSFDLPSTLGPVHPTAQFCDLVALSAAFPEGDSLLTVQLADTAGMIGPTAQIVLRIVTPTPAPPP